MQIANRSSRAAAPGMGAWAAGWHGVRALTLANNSTMNWRAGIHVALVIVDGPIESPKTARMIAALSPARSTTRPTSQTRSSASPTKAGAAAPTN